MVAVSILGAIALLGCGGSTTTATVTATKTVAAGTPVTTTETVTTTKTVTTTRPPHPPRPPLRVTLALADGDAVVCTMTSNGATCPLHGTAKANSGMEVLLWVEPVHPSAPTFPDYYIQRGQGVGVTREPQPATTSPWEGALQIGNTQFPPCRGDTLNVIATLADANVAARLRGSAQQTYTYPAGAKEALAFAQAKNVTVAGVPPCRH